MMLCTASNSYGSNMANLRCFIHQEAALAEEDADCARAVHHWQQVHFHMDIMLFSLSFCAFSAEKDLGVTLLVTFLSHGS